MVKIALRESEPFGEVVVFIDGVEVYRDDEYRGAVYWLEARFPRAWAAQHPQVQQAYRADYDDRRDND